MSHECTNTVLV